MFSIYFYVKFNGFVVNYSAYSTYSCIRYYEFFKLAKLLGGGGQNDMFAPQYFHWGGDCPPPPRIDASVCGHVTVTEVITCQFKN